VWHPFRRVVSWDVLTHCRPLVSMVFAVPPDSVDAPPRRGQRGAGQPPPGHPERAADHPPSAAESVLWSQIQPM